MITVLPHASGEWNACVFALLADQHVDHCDVRLEYRTPFLTLKEVTTMISNASVELVPEHKLLEAALRSMCNDPHVVILDRRLPMYTSTFQNEVVTCRIRGELRSLLLKYGRSDADHVNGHRGGLAYEAAVYEDILQRVDLPSAAFYGTHQDETGETWLAIEYLENAHRVALAPEPHLAITESARWIGTFHRKMATRFRSSRPAFITKYDATYYRNSPRWGVRAVHFGGDRHPWLEMLQRNFGEVVEILLQAPYTLIHSEYYPKNILIRGSRVFPIDWESAAFGAGEIDLASLTEGWGSEIGYEAKREYCRARWPEGPPPHFERTLLAAGIYLLLRKIGEGRVNEESHWVFDLLRTLAERLGILA